MEKSKMKIELRRYTLAIISMAILLSAIYVNNLQYADAVVLRSRVFHTSIANEGFTYYSGLDYIVHVSSTGGQTMQVMRADTLAGVQNITLPATGVGGTTFSDIVTCLFFSGEHRCFYAAAPSGASVIIATQEIQAPYDFLTYTNTTYGGCKITTYTQASGNVYATVQDSGAALCSGSEIGTWIINVGCFFSASCSASQIIQRPSGLQGKFVSTSSLYDHACFDSTTNKIAVAGDNALYRVNTITNTYDSDISMASAGNVITSVFCANGFAIVSSLVGDYIKVVNLSTGTVVTTSINAPQSVIKHNNDLYMTNTSSAITIFPYSTTASMTPSGTISPISASTQYLMKANATRMNVITGTEFIYAVDGLPNDGSQTPQAPFVCVDIDLSSIVGAVSLLHVCDTDGDGIPDITQNQQAKVNQNITTSTFTIFCIAGITDCNNTNIKTNGVGIMLLLLLIILTIAIIMAITMKTQHEVSEIHPLLWLTVIFVDVAGAWYLKWIEDIIFYGLLVVFIGLGAFGVYRHLRDG